MPDSGLINNWVFAAFPEEEQSLLLSEMRRVHTPRGDDLALTGDSLEVVYFPVTSEIANIVRADDGKSVASSTVGRDGVTGLAAFLAKDRLGWDLRVDIAGYAWSLPADVLRERHQANPAVADLLLQVTHNNQIESARNILCAAHHRVAPRLARWLLTIQDRTAFRELPYTQEQFAERLGIRRTTINAASKELVAAGAISQFRGRTLIRDRAILKSLACSCYRATQTTRLPRVGMIKGLDADEAHDE